jgi:hypothetical protein
VGEDALAMVAVLAVVLDKLPVLVIPDPLGPDESHDTLLSAW